MAIASKVFKMDLTKKCEFYMKNGYSNCLLQFYKETFKTSANIVEISWSYFSAYVLSELILTDKIMRKKNFKIQMLAGNTLKISVCASFEISMTLIILLS